VEFYGIVSNGGFDVIIGNPPYVEYHKVQKQNTLRGFRTEKCSNLYAYVVERSLALMASHGSFGMILPMSLVSTNRMVTLREELLAKLSVLHLSNYSGNRNPSVLFKGVEMRLTITLGVRRGHEAGGCNLFTTGFLRWSTEARNVLFPTLSYVKVTEKLIRGEIPKLGADCETAILQKLFAQKKTLGVFESASSEHQAYAHRIASYFVKCFNFVPYFYNDRDGYKKSEDYKIFPFKSDDEALLASAFVNSTLFYFYYIVYSDAYHCGRELIQSFPCEMPPADSASRRNLLAICDRLMRDLQANAVRQRIAYRNTGWVELDKYYPKLSKPIIDEIDQELARLYGFTDEELDFIINDDIKYRMGREADDE
jgi:hypothetical protein